METKNKGKNTISSPLIKVIIVLVLLLIGVGYFGYNYYGKYISEVKSRTSLVNGLNGELKIERNKNGSLTATIATMDLTNKNMLLDIKSKDDAIIQLQNIIKRKDKINKDLNNAIAIQTEIFLRYKDSINENKVIGDTTIGDTTFQTYERNFVLYNNYDSNDTTEWVFGNVILGKMIFEIELNIKNKYDVAIGRKRKNIFSPWQMYADITTYNPYDNITKVRSYSKQKMRPKRFGIGISAGVGFTYSGIGPYVGIGVNYNIIEF